MIPSVALNDGTAIPQLGYGTLYVSPEQDASVGDTADVVRLALEVGYRHLDTAQSYGTEAGVGRAVAQSGVARSEMYVTTKLGNANHWVEDVKRTFLQSLDDLEMDYLDLFLMHWPLPTLYDGDYVSTWRAMTELVEGGRLRSVGVSNFEPAHLARIIDATGVVPAVNQIEVHPYFRNSSACAASEAAGIAIQAWSPLGRRAVLDDPTIEGIADERGKSPAQVVLRWHVQHGHVVFPKTVRRERMEENQRIFDFALDEGEMAAIDALDRGEGGRIGPHPDVFAEIR